MQESFDRYGPANWRAQEMRQWTRWLIELSSEHQREIRAAVSESWTSRRDVSAMTRANFKLPALGPTLEKARRQVVEGCGFVLIRGLSLDGLGREAIVRAYFGVGAHLGVARPQNRNGHLVGHVKDLGHDALDPKTRIYTTNRRQRFHVDSCDIVGLLCLQPAKRGGSSAICSSTAIAEEIRHTRPELADALESPFIYDRKDEIPRDKGPYYRMPIVHRFDGREAKVLAEMLPWLRERGLVSG